MPALKTYFNWSTGKDSALALNCLLQDKNYSVDHLITSVNEYHNRVSMHGLRRELLMEQVNAIGIPHTTIELPEQPSMRQYEALMNKTVLDLRQKGFEWAGFGDIFLEDLRRYREQQLAALDIKIVFPLWKKDTRGLLNQFIDSGFRAIVVCINAGLMDASFAGRMIGKDFINDLPAGIDPCGENGEFHSFCFAGPIFKQAINFTVGEKVYREYKSPEDQKANTGFWFCDLLPANDNGR